MALKYSRQRQVIYDFLMTRKDHPTAETVYRNVRQKYPNISLGTVYRNLTLLADMGEIQRLRVGDGIDHFDADTSEHYHFVCSECGGVTDLKMKSIEKILETARKDFEGEIQGHVTYFYGICDQCKKKLIPSELTLRDSLRELEKTEQFPYNKKSKFASQINFARSASRTRISGGISYTQINQ